MAAMQLELGTFPNPVWACRFIMRLPSVDVSEGCIPASRNQCLESSLARLVGIWIATQTNHRNVIRIQVGVSSLNIDIEIAVAKRRPSMAKALVEKLFGFPRRWIQDEQRLPTYRTSEDDLPAQGVRVADVLLEARERVAVIPMALSGVMAKLCMHFLPTAADFLQPHQHFSIRGFEGVLCEALTYFVVCLPHECSVTSAVPSDWRAVEVRAPL